MKKRHVTELSGTELEAVFKAAVIEAWQSAAGRGLDVEGTAGISVKDDSTMVLRKPDGSIKRVRETDASPTRSPKRTAA